MKRLSATLRRGHISDERLDELARARVPVATAADPTELHHLSGCRRCRGMIGGFARAETVLGGAWVDRPLHSRPAVQGGADRVGRELPLRVRGQGHVETGKPGPMAVRQKGAILWTP